MKKWIALFGVLFLVACTVACVRTQSPATSKPSGTTGTSQSGSSSTTFGNTITTVTGVGSSVPTSSTPPLTLPTTLPPAPTTNVPTRPTTVPVAPGTTVPTPPTTLPVPPTTLPVPPTTEATKPDEPVDPPILTGWINEGDRWYYFHEDGSMALGFVLINGGCYYFGSDGVMHTGWLDLEEGRYYFSPGGLMQIGWIVVDNNRYYLSESGHMQTGWVDVDNNRYFLNEDGTLFAGDWMFYEGDIFYIKENGAMARGMVEIDGVKNYFTSTGKSIMLVNPWNKLPEGYEPDLVSVTKYASSGQKVDAICYAQLMQMLEDCKANSQEARVISSYRTVEYQEYLFEKKITRLMNQGYSREQAEILAAQAVAVPGTSEHHLGLAVDIVDKAYQTLDEHQAEMPAQKWLMENSWKYGFILRYPVGKTDVTGIIYEPWHYRYVGLELAEELHELGLTLEEYLQMLTDEAEQ